MALGSAYGDGFSGIANTTTPGTLYVTGSEFADDSVRLKMGRGRGAALVAKVERRTDGVWNTTEMELGQNSLLLGPNLSLGALGASLLIESLDGQRNYIPMDVPIDDTGSGTPRALIAGAILPRVIGQSDFSVDNVSAAHLVSRTTQILAFIHSIHLKMGATAPTKDVTLSVTGGLAAGGPLFYERVYPPSVFSANTEIELKDPIELGAFVEDAVSLEITSDVPFSLLGDSSNVAWFAVDVQPYVAEDVLSHPTGLSRILMGADGNPVSNNAGDFILLEAQDGPT